MTRSQFLGLLTLPFLTKFVNGEEPKEMYDGAELHSYIMDENGCWPSRRPDRSEIKKGDVWIVNTIDANPRNEVIDNNGNVFWVRQRKDDKIELGEIIWNSELGNEFAIIKTAFSEGTI